METLKMGVEKRLGFKVEDGQFQKSLHNARKKLHSIISRYGDADGRRRRPEYLQELICEDIGACVLAEATVLMAAAVLNMEKERLAGCLGTHGSTHIVARDCREINMED